MRLPTQHFIRVVSVCAMILSCTSTPAPAPVPARPPISDPVVHLNFAPFSQEFAGLYTSTTQEDHFIPCGVQDVGDGWALRFRNSREAPFLTSSMAVRGYPPLAHFIRVRGTLGPPGRYNFGFQTREFTVDSLLDVKETPPSCENYEDLPELWRGVPRKGRFIGATLSDDRSLAAVMDPNGRISIWATDRGTLLKEFSSQDKGNAATANRVPMIFSPDRTLLAVGGVDGTVRIWKPLEGKRMYTFARESSAPGLNDIARNSRGATIQLAFNKSASLLASTNGFSTLIWSLKTGKRLGELNPGHGYFSKVFFVGDSSLLVSGDSGRMMIYPRLGAAPTWTATTGARAFEYMVRSPDQRRVAINGWGDSVFLWTLGEQSAGPILGVPSYGGGAAMAFSPDGNTIATAGGSYGVYLWDARTGAPIRSFHKYPGPVWYMWFSADGGSIITYSIYDDQLRVVSLDRRPRGPNTPAADSASAAVMAVVAPTNAPKTVAGVVSGPNKRAVAGAEVSLSNADAPDSVVQRTTTSSGGYFSFSGVRFPHIIVRVRKPGFETGVMYMHVRKWDTGPGGIELKAESTVVP